MARCLGSTMPFLTCVRVQLELCYLFGLDTLHSRLPRRMAICVVSHSELCANFGSFSTIASTFILSVPQKPVMPHSDLCPTARVATS